MVVAIVILFLLVILLGCGFVAVFNGYLDAERKIVTLQGQVARVSQDAKISHERLVDDLWRRADEQADELIEKARERGRGL